MSSTNQPMGPLDHLHRLSRRYPDAWREFDRLRAHPPPEVQWPAWCFAPMAAAYALATRGQPEPPQGIDVALLAAFGAWRPTQGVYAFHAEMQDALLSSSMAGDLPVDVLHTLPEWCVYVRTPGVACLGAALQGFWAHLEVDDGDGREELRLLLHFGETLLPIPIHLGGSLQAGLDKAHLEAMSQAALASGQAFPAMSSPLASAQLSGLVSMLLYLCIEEPELSAGGSGRPRRPRAQPRKKGKFPRLVPPDAPVVWQVGEQLGRRIAAGRTAEGASDRKGPAPHIRTAHWHTYWVGSERTQDRRRVLRWLPPIPVNAPDDEVLGDEGKGA